MLRIPVRSLTVLLLLFPLIVLLVPTPRATAGDDDEGHTTLRGIQSLLDKATVPLAKAVTAAETRARGRAVRASIDTEDGKPAYEVLVLVEGPPLRLVEVVVDASSGEVLETDVEATEGEAEARDDGAGAEESKGEEREEREGEEEDEGDEAHEGTSHGHPSAESQAFTDHFRLDPADLATTGRNPYFVLEPGYRLVLEKRGEHVERLVVTVLDEVKEVAGIQTRVVEERETLDGTETEVSRNYVAISKRTNDVYYFGEEEGGGWEAGREGARPGLLMSGTPLLGARYMMEIAPGRAMDQARIVGLGERFETPAGTLEDCLRVEETSPLEPGTRETKIYAPGIGIVYDGGLRLVEHGKR